MRNPYACTRGAVVGCAVIWLMSLLVSSSAFAQACPGEGDCFGPNGTVGCDNAECCEAVCAIDPFCCDTEWDQVCADEAVELCASCGGEAAGNCYEANGTAGCNNAACCDAVCLVDPFCCDTEWDSTCAAEAAELCGDCGSAKAGDCLAANGTIGCDNADCCAAVCAIDPFCCNTEWDQICADAAAEICASCGGAAAGDCFAPNGTTGCDNSDCCNAVCAIDPFCCDTEWDQICADEALELCTTCGGPGAGDCGVANGTPACNDADCCNTVCAVDPFCCDTEWDETCAAEAADLCGSACGDPLSGSCYEPNGSVGCDDAECCDAVCAIDPFCCDTEWDDICANEAAELCGNCGDPGAGGCFAANGSIGCDDADCCATVCAVDPFCCDTEWDGICAGEAAELCNACPQDCVTSKTFAPPPDGVVDGADLANLLGSWSPSPCDPNCCADTVTSLTFQPPPDGVVDGADLAALLGAWGDPPCQN